MSSNATTVKQGQITNFAYFKFLHSHIIFCWLMKVMINFWDEFKILKPILYIFFCYFFTNFMTWGNVWPFWGKSITKKIYYSSFLISLKDVFYWCVVVNIKNYVIINIHNKVFFLSMQHLRYKLPIKSLILKIHQTVLFFYTLRWLN